MAKVDEGIAMELSYVYLRYVRNVPVEALTRFRVARSLREEVEFD
jgi:hypothetical protein